jgi:hypothetical protein
MRHPIRKNIRIKRLPFTVCSFLKEKVRHKESGYRASQQAAIISMLSLLGSSVAALLVSHFFFKKGANREG